MSQLATEEVTYCAVHPDRETALRCYKCGRLICVECAVRTPVGYRCRECVRAHQDKFYNAATTDYAIVFAVCAVLSGLGAFVVSRLVSQLGSFWLVVWLGAPIGGAIGSAIGKAALRLTGRRRGRSSAEIAVAGVVAGGLAYMLLSGLAYMLLTTDGDLFVSVSLLLYIGIVSVAVYGMYKLRF